MTTTARSLLIAKTAMNCSCYFLKIATFGITSNESTTSNILFLKNIRKVFRKCHYCVGCKVCEANCKFGNLSFDSEGNVIVSNHVNAADNVWILILDAMYINHYGYRKA